jgi:glutamate-1-semialdehyde 2,1-aminomutase
MAAQVASRTASLVERAERLFPGGVNSPVRAFRAVGRPPLVLERGQGPYVWDADGRRYLDYIGAWGPAILGHGHPRVIDAIMAAVSNGLALGATNPLEVELGEAIRAAMPSIERLRFTSSGTEAVMSALRVARAATGRDVIVKFGGAYHGHADGLLVEAGSGLATLAISGSGGVPAVIAATTIVLPFNDPTSVTRAFAEHPGRIAAVIVEPVIANSGVIAPIQGFLEQLRETTRAHGALLVFDEVITGFRLERGGAQARFGIQPDLTTLGKIIGGGPTCWTSSRRPALSIRPGRSPAIRCRWRRVWRPWRSSPPIGTPRSKKPPPRSRPGSPMRGRTPGERSRSARSGRC